MVDVIYDLKNQLLEDLEKDAREHGVDRLDKEKVDMVKDLAQAEKDCWKASYYRAVTEAMENGSGYSEGMGYGYGYGYDGMSGASRGGGRSGAQSGGSGASRGGGSGYRNSMGQFARRGYGMGYHEHIDALKMEMMNANPQEREQILQEIRGMGMA